jgi:hypothetical protein
MHSAVGDTGHVAGRMNILSTDHAAGRSAPRDTTAFARMVPPVPTPSARLVRAAAAERAEIARHRDRMLTARDRLRAELAEVEAALRDLDERDALLDRLSAAPLAAAPPAQAGGRGAAGAAPGSDGRGRAALAPAAAAGIPAPPGREGGQPAATVLRGPAIRRTAVEVLRSLPERPHALHYRAWFDALRAAGFDVAGKDPLAVFLTQLSRSPVVRRGTQSGVYELDPDAPRRLRERLDALHAELRGLTATPSATTDLLAIRARREALTTQITQVEKALEEAAAVLAPAGEGPRAAAG